MTRQVSEYSNKWKMTFNPDITTKQAQEVEFSRKSIKTNHRPVFFDDIPLACTDCKMILVCISTTNIF